MAWPRARGALALLAPVFPGEPLPFGPRPASEVALSVAVMTGVCAAAGAYLTRSPLLVHLAARLHPDLRDEAWEEIKFGIAEDAQANIEEAEDKYGRRNMKKRTAPELLFISVHNSAVSVLAAMAWLLGSPVLALYAFSLEVAYEIFDTSSLGLARLEPETLIHHIVSPICILGSTQTEVDFRVLCHLCVCIDVSGAILGYSKFLLRYAHVSTTRVYWHLTWVFAILRVVGPLIDTAIIVWKEVTTRGGLFSIGALMGSDVPSGSFAKTDWTQLYFWAIAVLNAFNIYFCFVIRARARMPPQLAANLERTGCH